MTASANYKLTYGKTITGAACKRGGGCVDERSPGKITLGQLRLDATEKKFTASYHLGCVSATTAADCLHALGGGEKDDDDALDRAVETLLEGLRSEHLEDDAFVESTRDALETTLGSGKGSDGLNDEQRAFLEGVRDESTTKGKKKSAPAGTSKAKPKSAKPATKKSAAAKSKSTTKKRGAKAAAASSKRTTKKRKTEESEEEEEEEEEDVEEHADDEHESESANTPPTTKKKTRRPGVD